MQTQTDTVYLYTDGACSGNPGPGGYCAVLKYGEYQKTVSGGCADTTNNRMELSAVIEGLRALNRPCEVVLTTDSKYIADAITKHWLKSWKKNNWVKSDKKPVLNRDLWEALDALLQTHTVEIQWVKGHAGHPENELCDEIAVMEANKYK
ncbi:MAG: ribonuclease HI [Oscillospiraceae bacterium]|jgi:ribonuclease HI|nr:ribonuclease HI [Oscillospiraceae bacterium]